MQTGAEENYISHIFDTMSYGPVPDSEELAKAWLTDHQNHLGTFANGLLGTAFIVEPISYGKTRATIDVPMEKEVTKVTSSSQEAFEKWKGFSFSKRAHCLYSIARNIQKHQSLMVILETIQSQRPIYYARDVGVPYLIRSFYHYAGWAQLLENHSKEIEPLGVVVVMIDERSSSLSLCWGIAPALATGNTIILAPNQISYLSCLFFAEICIQAGLPPGVVNVIPGYVTASSILCTHRAVKKILFSGVPDDARKLQKETACFSNNVSVDTGGRPTVVVMDSADIDGAVEGIIETLLYNDCRSYCAGVRVLAQDPIYKLVVQKVEKRVDKLRIGNFLDKNVDLPNICLRVATQEKLLKCLNEAKKEGSHIHPSLDDVPAGSSFPPIVVSGIQTSASLLCEEVGGPVVIILPFRTTQEAISLANNGSFNSSVSVWSERHAVAMEIAYKVKSNVVWINCQNIVDPAVSYGSYIHTGISQDGGEWALMHFRTFPNQLPGSSINKDINFGLRPTIVSPKFELAQGVEKQPMIDHTHKLYYGGAQKRPDSNSSYSVYNFNKKIIGYAPNASTKDVRNAVEAAQTALSGWSGKSGHNKAQILYYIAENLSLRLEEFCKRISELTGKSFKDSRNEVEEAIDIIFYWAATCDKYRNTVQETPLCKTVVTIAEPLGVVGIICRNWKDKSSPLFSFISPLIAAVAAGNAVIVIPSENDALIALDMYQILDTSDVPNGVINILSGSQDHLTRCLAEHQNVQGLWYHAGSVEGASFVTCAAAENFKRVWVNPFAPSIKSSKQQRKEFVFYGTKRKCIWLPSGDAFP